MSNLDYLRNALPSGTRYALRVIKKPAALNRWHTSADSLFAEAEQYSNDGWNVYYATAGFGVGLEADCDNAVAKREFYVDVDCGPSKPYPTKAEGLQALKDFCIKRGLPKPTLIDSGNGIHAHWILKDAVPVHEWEPVAVALKQHCINDGFRVDHACTADTVRVLRIPGTINTRGDHAVTLLTPVKHFDFIKLKNAIGEPSTPQPDLFKKARELTQSSGVKTEVSKLYESNRVSKFETIWIKSVAGDGCAQVKNAIENAETLSEPVWRGVLSIAQVCEDRDWAIHEISKNHPDYDAHQTEQKAALTKGPYTCETFQGMETSPLCAGCRYAGSITSPVQLGSEVEEAPPVPQVVKIDETEYEIPAYPEPFFRGKNGGIYQYVIDKESKEREPEMLYAHDLYVFKRMRDLELGDVVWVRHHLPNDGVREFPIAQKELAAIDKFRDRICEQGVTAFTVKQLNGLQFLFSKQIQELQYKERAEAMHNRFGWTKDDTFVVGNREYTARGVVHAPVVRSLEKYTPWFVPKGSLETWKQIANLYNDETMDLHAYGLMSSFGSVLMHISPESGAVLNYFSKKSGTGKTTILRMANSVFGNPKDMMKDSQDTALTKVHRMGVYNGIVICLDEMTNVKPEELSSLLYGSTQGRGRDRMKSSENAERVNNVTWKGSSIWSSNTACEDRLGLLKIDPQGELARVIEIHLKAPVPKDVLESQKLFNSLNENYGHAGDIFLRYVIPNLDAVRRIWEATRDRIYAMRSWTQTERYKLNKVICDVTAGLITNSLGLTNYNIQRITKKIINVIADSSTDLRTMGMKAVETIASFVNRNAQNILIIEDASRINGLQKPASVSPKGALMVRWETDTKCLFIIQRELNRWCAENFINAKELRSQFKEETGKELLVSKKRMGKGWNTDFGPVSTYEIRDADTVLGMEMFDEQYAAARAATPPDAVQWSGLQVTQNAVDQQQFLYPDVET